MLMLRAIVVMVAVIAAPVAAIADEPTPPAADPKDEARALNQTGVNLLNKKDYRGALAVFRDAYAKYPSAKILLNIGTTLKALGRDIEAANTYQKYLDAADTDPNRKPEIDAVLAELDKKLAHLVVEVAPGDADVQFNRAGEWMPARAAHHYRLAPGEFGIRARADGYAPAEQRGTGVAGQTTTVTINLIEEPPEEDLHVEGEKPDVVAVAPVRPRSRFGATVGAHFDPMNKGAAATVGVCAAVVERVEINAAALLGPNQGGYLGATVYVLTGAWRPTVSISAPVFFSDGARVSARGAGGLEIVASRHLSVVAELGVERAINPEPDIEKWAFVPSIAVHGRL